jgi:hypothetical protein
MTSISGGIESTYFWTDLYKWNPQLRSGHGDWQLVARKGWYAGASNKNGKLPLTSGPLGTVYWSLNGGAISGNYDGWNNLAPGHYTTMEYYRWQNGSTASRWNGAAYCTI